MQHVVQWLYICNIIGIFHILIKSGTIGHFFTKIYGSHRNAETFKSEYCFEISDGPFGQIQFTIFSVVKQVVGAGSSGDWPSKICLLQVPVLLRFNSRLSVPHPSWTGKYSRNF